MSLPKFTLAAVLGVMLAGLCSAAAPADNPPAKPDPAGPLAWDAPPFAPGMLREAVGPRDAHFMGAPRDGDLDRPPPPDGPNGPGPARGKPPRDSEFDRPPPPDGPDGPGPARGKPPRDGDLDRPPSPPHWPHGDAESLRSGDPEMFKLIQADMELDRQSRDLAAQYQKASAEERGKLKGLVEQAVNKHFEVRQERRALELKRLEEELKRLHEAIERRAKARKEIVAKRLAELLGQADDMHF
jgi:hypothetical protein